MKGAGLSDVSVHVGPDPIDTNAALASVAGPAWGGTALFCGTVRTPNEGQDVDHLDYEAWDGPALDALRRICEEALHRFGAGRAYVAHRTGRVAAGEPSVVVAVSAPHRAEAFDACRSVIDALKVDAPIWKKEVTSSGERWVENVREAELR